MSTSIAERKRRVGMQMATRRKELKQMLGVESTTGNRVVIHFAGTKEEFWFKEGEEPYRTPNGITLDARDDAVLWALARDSCSASRASYVRNDTRKRRKGVEPQPVSNRKKSRTPTAVEAARATFLYSLYENQTSPPFFRQLLVSGQKVEFRTGNYVHQLVKNFDKAILQRSIWLSLEWFSFMCCFGEQLMVAADKGYKSTNPPKAVSRKIGPTPRHDLRQKQMLI